MPHQTNVEFVTDLMQFSRRGALIQVFVITALQRYAEAVQREPIPETGGLSSEAWSDCANEVLEKLETHLK